MCFMIPYHTILFDLDGTLTDPKVGITKVDTVEKLKTLFLT